ncbi:MAG: hypothetical protein K1X53_17185 [Candidatus Sumerlaeaceae bacterium]|nr:hypothetical protein [Candidatus Sumerlaeaceae bacterium]
MAKEPANDAPKDEKARLATFKIGSSNRELMHFLEAGFPKEVNIAKLPEEPRDRSQLAVDAMSLLSKAGATEAAPILLQIAQMNPPPGVATLVELDLRNSSPRERDTFREKALRILQFNAINALSLIGDRQAIPVIRVAFSGEQSVAAKIQYALALGLLGDTAGIDFMVKVMAEGTRKEAGAAARSFTIITGQDFGMTEWSSLRTRKTLSRKYADWWKANKATFQVDIVQARTRRLQPVTPVPFQARSTRDLLKQSSYLFDFNNRMQSRDARERLKAGGTKINPDLEKIATDETEDLDIRMAAMNWYFENNRTGSKALMKKLLRDENPEIVDKAKAILEQIEDETAATTTGKR